MGKVFLLLFLQKKKTFAFLPEAMRRRQFHNRVQGAPSTGAGAHWLRPPGGRQIRPDGFQDRCRAMSLAISAPVSSARIGAT